LASIIGIYHDERSSECQNVKLIGFSKTLIHGVSYILVCMYVRMYMCVSCVHTFRLQNTLPSCDGNLKNILSLRKRPVNYSCWSGQDSVKSSPGVNFPYTLHTWPTLHMGCVFLPWRLKQHVPSKR